MIIHRHMKIFGEEPEYGYFRSSEEGHKMGRVKNH
jgi:hypothetical protein